MQTNLFWKKDFFTSTYSILTGSQFAGKLINSYFGKTAHVAVNGKLYRFVTKGLFDKRTMIIDISDGHWVGEIIYGTWMDGANIALHDTLFDWKFDNIWNSKASIMGPNNVDIKYNISTTSGEITSNTDDTTLMMAGLYIADYYKQKLLLLSISTLFFVGLILLN